MTALTGFLGYYSETITLNVRLLSPRTLSTYSNRASAVAHSPIVTHPKEPGWSLPFSAFVGEKCISRYYYTANKLLLMHVKHRK